jgi:hypothetical protein
MQYKALAIIVCELRAFVYTQVFWCVFLLDPGLNACMHAPEHTRGRGPNVFTVFKVLVNYRFSED